MYLQVHSSALGISMQGLPTTDNPAWMKTMEWIAESQRIDSPKNASEREFWERGLDLHNSIRALSDKDFTQGYLGKGTRGRLLLFHFVT